MVPTAQLDRMDADGLAWARRRIVAIEPGLKDVLSVSGSWECKSQLVPVRLRVSSWTADGAALIGDAAHACHPHVAQGSFQAMEDGKVLAEVLDQCFARGDVSSRALAAYENIRRPVCERLQRVANEYAWLWENRNPILVRLRDRIFRTIGNRPELLYKVAATEAGLLTSSLTFRERLQALGVCA
jgi:2-polyprenyl-6-methoxyphenol hydroxylase-like FAD-dependent oxidoreductase